MMCNMLMDVGPWPYGDEMTFWPTQSLKDPPLLLQHSSLPQTAVMAHRVTLGGAATVARTSLGGPGAPMDLLYFPRFLGDGG